MKNDKQIEVINEKIKELQAEVDLLSSPVFDRWDLVPVDTPVFDGNGQPRFFSSVGNYFCDARTSRRNGGEFRDSNINLDTEAENIYAYKPWFGGECPVGSNDIVRFITGGGGQTVFVSRAEALAWKWRHNGKQGDIVLYSVIK